MPSPSRRRTPSVDALARLAAEAVAARDAQATQAQALLDGIAARKPRLAAEFHEMGRDLAELSDGNFHSALGFRNFATMIEAHGLLSREVAWRLIAIARFLPRQTALRLGLQRSIEWLRLLRAEAGPDATDQQVRRAAHRSAVVQGAPVADLSTRRLVALRRLAEERRAREHDGGAEADRLARNLARLLARRGAEDARVVAHYGRAWTLRIHLGLAAARAVLAALETK
jgi:hypothetical protein